MIKRCNKCSCERKGNYCWKCGTELIEVEYKDWKEPRKVSVTLIRNFAYKHGYAISVHGSTERDIDLVATPWDDYACDAMVLLENIVNFFKAAIIKVEYKPHGRVAASIQFDCYCKVVDLSIAPKC